MFYKKSNGDEAENKDETDVKNEPPIEKTKPKRNSQLNIDQIVNEVL